MEGLWRSEVCKPQAGINKPLQRGHVELVKVLGRKLRLSDLALRRLE